jgi:hypothetical protein
VLLRSSRNYWPKGYLLAPPSERAAQATPVGISVPGASQIEYQISSDDKSYLRNIDLFVSGRAGLLLQLLRRYDHSRGREPSRHGRLSRVQDYVAGP